MLVAPSASRLAYWGLLTTLLALASGPVLAQPQPPPAEAGDPRYLIEGIQIRGARKTEPWVVLRGLGLAVGDEVTATDPRVELARLRLLSLGYFLDVHFSLEKGTRRGGAVLVVTVEERGTIIINAIHLGTSEATSLWGGLDIAETNFLGRGIGVGGGFVASSRPKVDNAIPGFAFALRAAGPLWGERAPAPFGSFLYSNGSEFFRAHGPDSEARPADFVAIRTRRAGATFGVGTDLNRVARVAIEGRYEAIDVQLPGTRTRDNDGAPIEPIHFGVHEGASRLASLGVTLDVDTRSDPVLPTQGARTTLTLQMALPVFASQYTYAKGVLQSSWYHAVGRHVLGVHGLAGAVLGDAPYFEQFFVGDLNFLLPPRALGLNFSTLPSRNFLGTSISAQRYDAFAARLVLEYAIPLWRRHGFFYRGDAFAAAGIFGLASADDLRVRDRSLGRSLPIDLTADLGLRLDTYVGIFTVSVANALGRIPF
jgi:outer membrane protein insertion porin family